MAKDKWIAIRNSKPKNEYKQRRRIPERKLLINAFLFGSFGSGLAMLPPVRHKIRNKKFLIGIPLALTLQVAMVYGASIYLPVNWYFDAEIVQQLMRLLS